MRAHNARRVDCPGAGWASGGLRDSPGRLRARRCRRWCAARPDRRVDQKGPRLRFRASDAGARAARCPPLVKWANSASGRRDRWTDRRFYRSRPRTGVTPCKCSGVDSGEDVDKTWASSHRQSGLRASRCAYSSERRTTDVTSLVVRHLPDTREALGTPRAAIYLERASGALFASGASTRVVRYVGVSRRRDRISQGAS